MDIYDIVLSAVGSIFLVFTAHLVLAKKEKRVFTWFLAVIIFARVVQIVIFLCVRYQNAELFAFFYRTFTPLYYVVPAALFLYITRLLERWERFTIKQIVHLVPFFIVAIHFLPIGEPKVAELDVVMSSITKNSQLFILDQTGNFPNVILVVLRSGLIVGYLAAAWCVFVRSKVFKADGWMPVKRWIAVILGFSTSFHLISLLPLFIGGRTNMVPLFVGANCVFLLLLILYLLHKPELLYQYLLVNVKPVNLQQKGQKKQKSVNLKSAELTVAESNAVGGEDLEALMEREQLFLSTNLQIKNLANRLDLPVHQCSAIINNEIGRNFRDWVNTYRVRFFIANYPDKRVVMTIEALAKEAGFKSLSSFYAAFKKETGIMPKQYFSQKGN